ncbi:MULTISPECIES: type VII toxin-antitoxin system HepT family RNase toxin [unclassified Sporolactobacillus]|uniref:type VII toxin-antitoxin system HepT family RNase toxin n=1 Tax=unclassified Sporolactobacillus TaxID=2628533 RepID=UPI002368B2CB|nr:DUF86 domain-containing protein [Sporolactobacillus sp. CQH2019]MDD9147392.1 DUF86 domain-containing protein [Sporolactobacillus sp. CQH2019]
MYFVDRRKIGGTLNYMNSLLDLFESENWDSPVGRLALERLAQILIESMIDVGNQMIDGFIMRDPGGYEDVIDILEDESVLPADDASAVKAVVHLRKMLVQEYTAVDHEQVRGVIKDHLTPLKQFSTHITEYLENELGPVSAFSPDTGQ